MECLLALENLQTYINERPMPDVSITDCQVIYEP